MPDIIYPDESFKILGACFEVYKEKGTGFLEAVFQECLQYEFQDRQVPFVAHPNRTLRYKSRVLNQTYTPDFICFEKIIVEIKAVTALAAEHRAQIHNYLRATGCRLGILVNFGHFPKVEYERVAL